MIRTLIYLALIFLAFGLAGANDLREEERLSMAGFVYDHLAADEVVTGGCR